MTRTIAKLADRLLSVVVPQTTATAGMEYRCLFCYGSIMQKSWRYCAGDCSQWYYDPCGSC